MIALLGALREEISDLQRQMSLVEVHSESPCRLYSGDYRGRDVLLALTGMGRQRVEAATEFILERYSVTALVSLGFAGALAAHLQVGELVVCSTQHGATGPRQETDRPRSYRPDKGLLRLATQALKDSGVRGCIGSGVTVSQMASSPAQRQGLGRDFRALIVDMESYWVARIAADRQIPFVAARAISDTERDTLPPFDEILTPDGGWRRGKAISHFLRHPQHLAALVGLARNARVARRDLTTFAVCLVERLSL